MMQHHKVDVRTEYRQQEAQRTSDSMSLADRFPGVKSLSVLLACFDPKGVTKKSELKYTVNLANAKSVFRFLCPNTTCIGGDFDLSDELAAIIAEHGETASGEVRCEGWQSKTTVGEVHCHHLLRYTLSLGY
jgi:hypothetical protein